MQTKDSYWFRHDSSAGRGLKMRKMAFKFGHEGKGIYWDVIEILRDTNGYKFESDPDSLRLLCDIIGHKDPAKFLDWFNACVEIGLFTINGKYFSCDPLTSNMEKWEIKKANGSRGGRPPKKPNTKPNTKPNQKQIETIREQKRTEENRTEDDEEKKTPASSNGDRILTVETCKDHYLSNIRIMNAVSKNPKNDIELDQIPDRLEQFNEWLIGTGFETKQFKDYCTHFLSWHKKNKSKTNPKKRISL